MNGITKIDRYEANIQKNPEGCHGNGTLSHFIIIYGFRDNGRD